ncbi:unnamed protein product [Didymodactylos carnosus]|uniref:Hydantoin racemase n=1 Tax=Didymodactylos carnosus TaxID=1234261 RepID=A0A815HFQ2_9BILA|nr:unnamed protein product [Didymodactylos carnosus]CAF1350200.1 unnamed protein product [Didymodactylos carnosus]CAF3727384.1 unnamed protein product [Didymodactylos carnosus]CAF4219658.1 unnamed protein product [Didymodactylos carnosus]
MLASTSLPSSTQTKILLINPNSTTSMTSAAAKALIGLENFSSSQVDQFTAPSAAPAEITSFTTEILSAAASIHNLIPLLQQYDGFLVACFSEHPLVEMLREHTDKPVVGIMEASLVHATILGHRFGIVTTNKEWELLLAKSVRNMALDRRCGGIKAINISPASLELAGQDIVNVAMSKAAIELVEKNGCDVIVLGCAGMSGLESTVQQAVITMGSKVAVIDAVVAGYEILLGLVAVQKRGRQQVM